MLSQQTQMETNDEFDQITKILKVYLNQASNIKITQMFKNLQRSNFFFIYKTYVLKEKEGAKFSLRKTEFIAGCGRPFI